MTEIHSAVQEVVEGGCLAGGLGADMFTESDRQSGLLGPVRGAALAHLGNNHGPALIRLHISREKANAARAWPVMAQKGSPERLTGDP